MTEKLLVFGFSWLHHESSWCWERHSWCMEPKVHQSLGNIFFRNSSLLFKRDQVNNELMRTSLSSIHIQYLEIRLEFLHEIVGV